MISYSLTGFVKRQFGKTADRSHEVGKIMIASIAELISDRIGSMPAGERRAAQTLIANYPLTGLKTVAEFSAAAGVSSPTILRFVARLGFQNYPEFQSALQDELAAQLQSPATRTLNPSATGGAASPMLEATLDNMRETFRHLSDRQLADIAARQA
jgi:DNA-binding MurR/RpiR family transcriptional regulator